MEKQGRNEGAGDTFSIRQKPCAFLPTCLVPIQAIPKNQGSAEGLGTSGAVDLVGGWAVLHLTLRSRGSLAPGDGAWKLRQYRASRKTCNKRIHRGDDRHAAASELPARRGSCFRCNWLRVFLSGVTSWALVPFRVAQSFVLHLCRFLNLSGCKFCELA
jgi:hypothetical protein